MNKYTITWYKIELDHVGFCPHKTYQLDDISLYEIAIVKGDRSYEHSRTPPVSSNPPIIKVGEELCPVERIICVGTLLKIEPPSTKRREEHRLLGTLSDSLCLYYQMTPLTIVYNPASSKVEGQVTSNLFLPPSLKPGFTLVSSLFSVASKASQYQNITLIRNIQSAS